MTASKIDEFRSGVDVFEDAEVVDFAASYGVFSFALASRAVRLSQICTGRGRWAGSGRRA